MTDPEDDSDISGIDPIWAWEPYRRDEKGKIVMDADGNPVVRDALLPASKRHDKDYVEQEEDRSTVDSRWFRTSWDIARRLEDANFRRWTKVRAVMSYAAIRSLGWLPWYARRFGIRK